MKLKYMTKEQDTHFVNMEREAANRRLTGS
jgi:hypothetical protein